MSDSFCRWLIHSSLLSPLFFLPSSSSSLSSVNHLLWPIIFSGHSSSLANHLLHATSHSSLCHHLPISISYRLVVFSCMSSTYLFSLLAVPWRTPIYFVAIMRIYSILYVFSSTYLLSISIYLLSISLYISIVLLYYYIMDLRTIDSAYCGASHFCVVCSIRQFYHVASWHSDMSPRSAWSDHTLVLHRSWFMTHRVWCDGYSWRIT